MCPVTGLCGTSILIHYIPWPHVTLGHGGAPWWSNHWRDAIFYIAGEALECSYAMYFTRLSIAQMVLLLELYPGFSCIVSFSGCSILTQLVHWEVKPPTWALQHDEEIPTEFTRSFQRTFQICTNPHISEAGHRWPPAVKVAPELTHAAANNYVSHAHVLIFMAYEIHKWLVQK